MQSTLKGAFFYKLESIVIFELTTSRRGIFSLSSFCCEERFGCNHFTLMADKSIWHCHPCILANLMSMLGRLALARSFTTPKAVKPVVTHMFWSVADPAWGLCMWEAEKLQEKGIN